ncbi:hypothetical protein SAMN05444390_105378 [Marinobacterium lutimaris]|uniref:O-antigen ligase n=1 Tax=Marinobacterium lutimaris TaxID=568106 RepID=A0A1H6DBD7_9GAMM|nr:hypothetical protein SAMN05444390_105378 [Marinobacterium lutimaris]
MSIALSMSVFVILGLQQNIVYVFTLLPALVAIFFYKPKFSINLGWLFAYFAYVLLSIYWSGNDFLFFLKQVKYVAFIYLFVFAMHLYQEREFPFNFLLIPLLISSVSLAGLSVLFFVQNYGFLAWVNDFPRIALDDVVGLHEQIYLSCILVFTALSLMSVNNLKPISCVLVFLLACLIIAPFQTRAAYLGLGAGLLVLFFQKKQYKTVIMASAFLVILGGFIYFNVDRFEHNNYPRLIIWENAYNKVLSECNVWAGCGYSYDFNLYVGEVKIAQLHNLIFSQFFYGGIIGAVLFLLLMLRLTWVLYKSESVWLSPFLCSMVMFLTMRHHIISGPNISWLLIWMPLALSGIFFKPLFAKSSQSAKEKLA